MHRFPEATHRWPAARPLDGWATCACTQAELVRLSCNSALGSTPVSAQQASRHLTPNTRRSHHCYSGDCPSLDQLPGGAAFNLQGYRLVADAYLLALTRYLGGRGATFDFGLSLLLLKPTDRRRWVEVIPL